MTNTPMYRQINRAQRIRSPMLGAGLIALVLMVTYVALLSMHPEAKDQIRPKVVAGTAMSK